MEWDLIEVEINLKLEMMPSSAILVILLMIISILTDYRN